MKNAEKKTQPWRPLEIGRRVVVTGKFAKGQYGTVVERLKNHIPSLENTGVVLYDVALDAPPYRRTQFARYELRGLKRNGRPDMERVEP
jgi:hypothetical protein